jgi:hypothetical protein
MFVARWAGSYDGSLQFSGLVAQFLAFGLD